MFRSRFVSSSLLNTSMALFAIAVAIAAAASFRAEAQAPPEHSVARLWNEQLLEAIRTDIPKPSVHARNLFHVSIAMWDAWAYYEPTAEGYLYKEKSPLIAPPPAGAPTLETQAEPFGLVTFSSAAEPWPSDGWHDHDDEDDDETTDQSDDEDDDEGDDEDDDQDPDPEDPGPEVKVYDPAIEAARAEAISFAAYRVLKYRFPAGVFCHPGAEAANADFDAQMDALGYDRTFTLTEGDSPAAVGNRIAAMIIAYGQNDGAFEQALLCYPDNTGYMASNPNLIVDLPGNPDMVFPNRWQPLAFDYLVLQNGIIVGQAVQSFVGVGWGDVLTFGLTAADVPALPPPACATVSGTPQPYLDPGCPPQLGGVGDDVVKDAMLEVIRFQSEMDPGDAPIIDLSPGTVGNNALGADTGTGHPVNPFTGQPYAPNLVNQADALRVITSFWADGPHSETPPGHWNTLANYVTDHPQLGLKRIGGTGPVVNDLEWEVKLYLAINGAVHDAAVSAWGVKHYYDSSRPISLIRHMCELGQSSDPSGLSYHPQGMPLVPDLTEMITAESVEPGGKFEHLKGFCAGGGAATNVGQPCTQLDPDHNDSECPDDGPYDGYCQSSVGMVAARVWNGSPANPETELGGVSWRRCIDWEPYQAPTFVTPPFPGYTSGHSTFSRSAAEVMAAFTASPFFPGGLGTFTAEANEYLTFEEGPTDTVELQWATYFDASDQAAISRRIGGIHPFYDDFPARIMASQIGQKAYARALEFFDPPPPSTPAAETAPTPMPTESPARAPLERRMSKRSASP